MMRGVYGLAAAVLIAAGGNAPLAAPAAAQVTPAAAKTLKWIEAEYGVKVLKIRRVAVNGRPAFEAVVMNPAGDFNEAFQVNRLVVDAATGKLLPQVRHGAAGFRRSAEAPGVDGMAGEDVGPTARRKSAGN